MKTDYVPTASATCRVKTEHTTLKMYKTYEESIMSQWALWVDNLITDKRDSNARDVQTGLTDWTG
jgi:hypothetical protein